MNFFKKALVATAVVGTFGASAAKITPSTTILEISKEGIAANVAVPTTGFDINVKVEAQTPAASNLKVQFGAGVDLSLLTLTGTVDNSTAGKSSDGEMEITFGTGSFTFDNFAVNTKTDDAHFVTFDVSLGQPMNEGAAFNVKFTGASSASVAKAASATYTATDSGTVIDSGVGAISVEKDQFSFAVKTQFDALIVRTDDKKYTDDSDTDVLDLSLTNKSTLSRAITATGATALVSGNFKDVVVGELTGSATTGVNTASVDTADKELLLTLDAAAALAATNTATLSVDHAGTAIPATGDVKVKYTVSGNFTGGTKVLSSAADGGEWAIDATIINVPYFPVGYEGVNSQINLTNESTKAVDVIVSAIDNNGKVYAAKDLGYDLPKQTVTKLSQTAIMDLFSVPAGTKLSVTFNIDANEGVVNGYAFTSSAAGRAEISTSQQRGN